MSISTLKFPFCFDVESLQTDARQFSSEEWIRHFNTQYYQGDWSGVALRAAKGAHVQLYSDPNAKEGFIDTDMMTRCVYVPKVLETFQCEMTSVRFLKLGAGAQIRKHRDYKLGLEDGELRIHIPVLTNPQVEFILDEQKLDLKEGEAWYLNFNLHHSVRNDGTTDRVHLVIDCVVNDWLLSYFQ
jgi:hypothetical protein